MGILSSDLLWKNLKKVETKVWCASHRAIGGLGPLASYPGYRQSLAKADPG